MKHNKIYIPNFKSCWFLKYLLFCPTYKCFQQTHFVQVECSNGQTGFGRRRREIPSLPPDPNKVFEISITSFIKVDYKGENNIGKGYWFLLYLTSWRKWPAILMSVPNKHLSTYLFVWSDSIFSEKNTKSLKRFLLRLPDLAGLIILFLRL